MGFFSKLDPKIEKNIPELSGSKGAWMVSHPRIKKIDPDCPWGLSNSTIFGVGKTPDKAMDAYKAAVRAQSEAGNAKMIADYSDKEPYRSLAPARKRTVALAA